MNLPSPSLLAQESLPVLPKPSRNLISFFGQKPELSADAGDGGAAAVAAASDQLVTVSAPGMTFFTPFRTVL